MSYPKLVKLIVFVILFSVLIIIMRGINRGLDPMDEGSHLLSFSPLQPSGWKLSYWWVYVRYLSKLLPQSVVTFRLMRLIASVFTAIFFAFCFRKWLHLSYELDDSFLRLGIIGPFIVLGGLLDFVNGPISYSYDHMNGHLLALISGLLLLLLAEKNDDLEDRYYTYFIWLSLGFLSGLHFFVKFSAASISIVILLLILNYSFSNSSSFWKKWSLFSFILGIFISVIFTINIVGGLEIWLRLLKSFLLVTNTTSHGVIFVLYYSYIEIFDEGIYLLTYYIPVFLSIFLLIWFFRKGWRYSNIWFNLIVGLWLLISFLYATFQVSRHFPYTTFHLGILLLFLIIFAAVAWEPSKMKIKARTQNFQLHWMKILSIPLSVTASFVFLKTLLQVSSPWVLTAHKVVFSVLIGILIFLLILFFEDIWTWVLHILNSEKKLVFLYLVFLPFIGAFGTNTGVIEKSLSQAITWFAALIILFIQIQSKLEFFNLQLRQVIVAGMFVFVSLFSALQIVYGYVLHPYHLPTNLLHQTYELDNVQRLDGIMVDLESKRFYERLNETIIEHSDFSYGDPIIGLFNMPGFVYAVGGISPNVTFFTSKVEMVETCKLLEFAQIELDNPIILANTEIEVHNCLSNLNIHYPEDYRLVETLDVPYTYMVERGQGELSVFVPVTD